MHLYNSVLGRIHVLGHFFHYWKLPFLCVSVCVSGYSACTTTIYIIWILIKAMIVRGRLSSWVIYTIFVSLEQCVFFWAVARQLYESIHLAVSNLELLYLQNCFSKPSGYIWRSVPIFSRVESYQRPPPRSSNPLSRDLTLLSLSPNEPFTPVPRRPHAAPALLQRSPHAVSTLPQRRSNARNNTLTSLHAALTAVTPPPPRCT